MSTGSCPQDTEAISAIGIPDGEKYHFHYLSENSKEHQVEHNQLTVITANATHLQPNTCLSRFPHFMCQGGYSIIIIK